MIAPRSWTAQEIFDTVARHLHKQGVQALDASGNGCLYRTPAGLRCAVGCLIVVNGWHDLEAA